MNLSDQEFLGSMKNNSHKYNLKELVRRGIKNNSHVLKYLLSIQNKSSSLRYHSNRCMLKLFDPFHKSIEICEYPNLKITISHFSYEIKKVLRSINEEIISKDFITFIKVFEILLYKCLYKHKFILSSRDGSLLRKVKDDFFYLVENIKHKSKSIKEFLYFREVDTFFFKESWLFMLKNIYFLEKISFVLEFNDQKKCTSNIYELFLNTEKRYTNYLEEGFPENTITESNEPEIYSTVSSSKKLPIDYEVYEVKKEVGADENKNLFKNVIKKEDKLTDSLSMTWHLRRDKFK